MNSLNWIIYALYINCMILFKGIMIKAYGTVLIDVLLLLSTMLWDIAKEIYRLWIPVAEKDVTGEVVLVNNFNKLIEIQ